MSWPPACARTSNEPCGRGGFHWKSPGSSCVSTNRVWKDIPTWKSPTAERRRLHRPGSQPTASRRMADLAVSLGRLQLRNPVVVASGTFGYAGEMAGTVDFARLGAVIPKTVTRQPRVGNAPPRTVETPSGMLNSIGLDNDGVEHFIAHHLPYLRTLPTAVIVNVAGKSEDEFVELAE